MIRFYFNLLLLLTYSFSFAQQQTNYRFNASIGFHSIVNWGAEEFENLTEPYDAYTKYQSESYYIRYKSNNYSPGLAIGFGFDWISKPNYILRQEMSVFGNSVTERIDFEIVDIGDGDTTTRNDYSTEEVKLGYRGSVIDIGKTIGTKVGLLGMYVKDDVRLGFGLNWTRRFSEDVFRYGRGYNPWSWGRTTMNYLTHQLDVNIRFEYTFGRCSAFMSFSQKLLTLKSERGARYFYESTEIYPFSHNLDFRFPSMINAGIQLNFKKIK